MTPNTPSPYAADRTPDPERMFTLMGGCGVQDVDVELLEVDELSRARVRFVHFREQGVAYCGGFVTVPVLRLWAKDRARLKAQIDAARVRHAERRARLARLNCAANEPAPDLPPAA